MASDWDLSLHHLSWHPMLKPHVSQEPSPSLPRFGVVSLVLADLTVQTRFWLGIYHSMHCSMLGRCVRLFGVVLNRWHLGEVLSRGPLGEVLDSGHLGEVLSRGHLREVLSRGHLGEVLHTGQLVGVLHRGHLGEVLHSAFCGGDGTGSGRAVFSQC